MIKARCIERHRDKNGKVVDYILEDCNGNKQRIPAYQLKMSMIHKMIEVSNLKLTSDGRIIEDKESKDKIKRSTPKGSKVHTDIGKAIVLLSDSIRSMGEHLEYEVEDLFKMIGLNLVPYSEDIQYEQEIVFPYDDSEDNYYHNMYLKGIREALKREPKSIIGMYIDKFTDSSDTLCQELISHNTYDINKNPIVKSVNIIGAYTEKLVHDNMVDVQYYNKIHALKNMLSSVDLQACKVGNILGNSVFKFLDNNYFGVTSNDSFTVGHILTEDKSGAYISNLKLDKYAGFPENSGYSLIFETLQGTVARVHIFEFGVIAQNRAYPHKNLGIHMDINRKKDDLRTVSKKIAERLNKLAAKKLKDIEVQ